MSATEFICGQLRESIRNMLLQFSDGERETFSACLPPGKSLDTVSENTLRDLWNLCERSGGKP